MICWYSRLHYCHKTGGGVYHVVIRISYFGPNQRDVDQGGICYERDGTLDINKGYRIAFKLLYKNMFFTFSSK